jgi:Lipocalin-like domain
MRIMNILARRIPVCVASLLIASLASVAFAQSPAKSLRDQLVGHWQLVSVMIHGQSPYGDKAKGSMFLDASGHYSVVVVTAGDARSIAYFGKYTVSDADHLVTFHVDASSRASGADRDQNRLASLNGDELTLASQKPGPIGGVKMTWKLAN